MKIMTSTAVFTQHLRPIILQLLEIFDALIFPMNKQQLVAGIEKFWDSVTAEKCQRYIGHLCKVIPAVVDCEGRASGYHMPQ